MNGRIYTFAMLKNKGKFNKILSVLFKFCIIITALFTTLIFVLACIGSCISNKNIAKADFLTDYFDGNYFTPMSNFYLSNSGLNMIPNKDSSQSFLMGTDIVLTSRSITGVAGYDTIPAVAVRCCFPLSSHWFQYSYHRNGNVGEYEAPTYTVGGISYELLNFVRVPLGEDFNGSGSSMFYYGKTETYPNNWYSCIQYNFDLDFNNDVVRIKLSSSVVDVIDGYNANCIVNTVTYYDNNNNELSINFYCANSWGSSPVSAVLWEERNFYVKLNDGSYNEGYNDGFEEGRESAENSYNIGYSDGYDVGYNDGYIEGEENGYSNGYEDGSNNELTSANFFTKIFSILDVPIFGFISLGGIFRLVFVLAIGIWALKVFAGG